MKLNHLYCGDNLDILREQIPAESVDLIYLDPPFNSQRNYFFKSPKGEQSEAQITAFEDTWHWTSESARTLEQLKFKHGELAELLDLMVRQFGHNDLSAYLVMMAIRLVELHRVLKPTGSLYLHCDPTASHYLKMILDLIFGVKNFRNEITWKRTSAHNDPKRFGRIHDVLLYYAKDAQLVFFAPVYVEYNPDYIKKEFRQEAEGRWYKLEDLTAPWHGGESGRFEFHGRTPGLTRMWRLCKEEMERLWEAGLIKTDKNGVPLLRGLVTYLDDKKGMPVQDWWGDVLRVGNTSKERLGYPTQKPLALLERIIQASSKPGDIVMDSFCGCGTAIHAAQKLNRQWIGIDITHLAIALIEKRLKDAFPDIHFTVEGTPAINQIQYANY